MQEIYFRVESDLKLCSSYYEKLTEQHLLDNINQTIFCEPNSNDIKSPFITIKEIKTLLILLRQKQYCYLGHFFTHRFMYAVTVF